MSQVNTQSSMPAPAPTPAPLRVRAEQGNEWSTSTFTTAFKIGRTEDCEVCIKNEHVSRKHVEVVVENGSWVVRDLRSANGMFVDGERVPSAPVFTNLKIRLGVYGPFVEFEVAAQIVAEPPKPPKVEAPPEKPPLPKPPSTSEPPRDIATHYFGNPEDATVGDHTRMVRRAFAQVQSKQKKKYNGIIIALMTCAGIAVVTAVGFWWYARHLQEEAKKNRALAQEMFYTIKTIDLHLAALDQKLEASGDSKAIAEAASQRSQRQNLDAQYNHLLASLKVYDPNMSEEHKLVLRVTRIFGECELDVPPDFYAEIEKYIQMWKSSQRFANAIKLAKEKGYIDTIKQDFLDQRLPPQFFYLGMQESDFKEMAVGSPTRSGFAKGMWQFVPGTAEQYGLKLGPLVDQPREDPLDDRHHWDRETKAAAAYIKNLYNTDAQASGLLVMACYNWGEGSVLPLVQSMPKNPRERNFWKLLELYKDKIPQETYDYVFYIVSAAVIGEKPSLFGYNFDNPLESK